MSPFGNVTCPTLDIAKAAKAAMTVTVIIMRMSPPKKTLGRFLFGSFISPATKVPPAN